MTLTKNLGTVAGLLLFLSQGMASPVQALAVSPQKRCSNLEVFPTYFANNTKEITYSGGTWTTKTKQPQDVGGVESYSANSCASYTVKTPLTGGSVWIYCGKKADRGYFDVWANDKYLGQGDAYNAACTSNCTSAVVFNGDLTNVAEGATLTIRNRASDSRLAGKTPYLDLNQILFIPANC